MFRYIGLILTCLFASFAQAQSFDDAILAKVLPGWRTADGSHMAALLITLGPEWKTYWRAPGDAGIAPVFDWRGSSNLAQVSVEWPSPKPIKQGPYITIGYDQAVTLPLRVWPKRKGQNVTLKGEVEMGVCRDVCIPVRLKISQALSAGSKKPDPRIVAALAERPYSAREAGVQRVTCELSTAKDGLALRAEISVPPLGGSELAVIEAANPKIWIAPAKTKRQGGRLIALTTLHHVDGRAFALQRSDLRITVLGRGKAVDIQGCSAG